MHIADLAYSESGSPRRGSIVAFHGVTDSAASLHDLARHYNDYWRVYLVDTLGHGLSPRFTPDELIDPFQAALSAAKKLVTKLARQSPTGSVVLIGHSLGGALAAHTAADMPHLVDGVILEDPALLTEEQVELYLADAQQLVVKQEQVTAFVGEAVNALQSTYPNWPPSEAAGWAQGKTEVDREFVRTGIVGTFGRDVLKRISVPTLLVTGDGPDVLFDEEGIAEVDALGLPQVETVLIRNATHTVRRDQKESFYAHADKFINSLSIRRPHFYIDPELEPLIEDIPEQTTWDAQLMRDRGEELLGTPQELPKDVKVEVRTLGGVETRLISTHHPDDSPTRIIFAPHGGGYVAGLARYDDLRNAELALLFPDSVVASPEYRRAPEHPWPAGQEDCIASLSELAATYPEAEVVLYGDSAGSGLVREMLDHAPDELFDRVSRAVLLEPCIDPLMDSRSYQTLSGGPVWTHEAASAAWKAYLGDNGPDVLEPASRFESKRKEKFPATLVIVNAVDPLRDEGIAYALDLAENGVEVQLHMPAGTYHGSLSVPGSRVWSQVREIVSRFLA